MKFECSHPPTIHRESLFFDTPQDRSSSQESWQRALFDAVAETSRSKALSLICQALSVVEYRLAEIASEGPSYPSEALDLQHSQTYLGLMLECIGTEKGEFIWD